MSPQGQLGPSQVTGIGYLADHVTPGSGWWSPTLALLSTGLATAYHRAQNRRAWSVLEGTTISASRQASQ